jgi:hypothetical protein
MNAPRYPNVPPLGREERKRLQALFEEQKGEPKENSPDEGVVPDKGLGAFVEFMKKELGGDTEPVKQPVANLHALERQSARNKGPSRERVAQAGFITERRPRMRVVAEIAFVIIAVVVAAVSAYWVTTRLVY